MASDIVIGRPESEHLTIHVHRRALPECTDFWDSNWLRTTVTLRVGGYRADIEAALRTDELEDFRNALSILYSTLRRSARLVSMEGWLDIEIAAADKLGNLTVSGETKDDAGIGNTLSFTFREALDQTYLPPLIRALDRVLEEYPVVRRPG